MDYCSTCRRHLNGALVCPGCGAYAPDIAPGVVGGHPVPGPAATSHGTAGAGHRADAERPAAAGWFTAPARPTDTTRPGGTARPGERTRPVGAARPGEGTRALDTARPVERTRPLDTVRPFGATRPGDTGRPDATGPGDTARPDATRPGDTARPFAARPDDTTPSSGTARHTDVARASGTTYPAGTTSSAEAPRPVTSARHDAGSVVSTAPARPADTAQAGDTGPADATPRALPAGPGTGRAARRRQVTRWRKTQRRALVATAVALVGGGITLASTDRGGSDRAQAATAPDLHGMGGATTEDAPVPAASPDTTTAPPRADDRGRARPEAAPAGAPPSRTHADGAAATEVPSGGRSDAPESVSRSGGRSEASQDTGRDSPATGGSTTPTRPSTPPPAADDGSGGTDDDGTDQGDGSSAQPTPSTPPPTTEQPRDPRLCLLVICLG